MTVRALRIVVAAAMGATVLFAGTSPATALTSINRGAMAQWARNWSTCHAADYLVLGACTPVGRNPASKYGIAYYVEFDSDCTNFVSSALNLGGGMPMDSIWYSKRHFLVLYDRAYAWSLVNRFTLHWQYGVPGQTYTTWTSPTVNTQTADLGDVILYNWGKGKNYNHLAVETGYGSGSWKDVNGRTHSFYGDLVSQHSNPRRNSPWNLGYLRETNPTYRAVMRQEGWYIIHWTNAYNGY
ncbi:MAG: amidase domain-containing protein [Frankiaceae bacterium]